MTTAGVLRPAVASLRVYEPLAAFDGEERAHWEAYARSGGSGDVEDGVAREREAALRGLAAVPVRALPQLGPQAFVTEVDGVTLVCPWRTRERALHALDAFRDGVPDEVLEAFLPRAQLDQSDAELDRLRDEQPDLRLHVQTSPWQVPARWFVLVDADEREISLGAPAALGEADGSTRVVGRRLVYRTPMSRARRRAAKALDVLRRTVDDGPITRSVEHLGRWLEQFHPRSLVELDYGGLTHLLDDAELQQDESARDVAGALAALDRGDAAAATAAYGRVRARAQALQGVESAN
jgi:hypothetical protein